MARLAKLSHIGLEDTGAEGLGFGCDTGSSDCREPVKLPASPSALHVAIILTFYGL